ncbi:MAG: hypothetical protein ABIL18_04085 [candidate division WOR-3 bacterium]
MKLQSPSCHAEFISASHPDAQNLAVAFWNLSIVWDLVIGISFLNFSARP